MVLRSIHYPVPESGRGLARRTGIGVLVAVVFVLLAQAVVDALGTDVGVTGSMSPFAAGPLIGASIAAGVGAAIVYAGVARVTDRPVRNFIVISVAVFVLMLAPVFLAPPAGITAAGQGILVLYHLLVAIPLVLFILGVLDV